MTATLEDVRELDLDSGFPATQEQFEAAFPEGVNVKIRHGLFTYWQSEEGLLQDGTLGRVITEQNALHQQYAKIEFLKDLIKGLEHGAFFLPEDEAATAHAEDFDPEDLETVELKDLPHEDLVDWLLSTGRFDGNKKPNIGEVVDAAEGDADFAVRLLAAEKEATGDSPRAGVVTGLEAVIDEATKGDS